MKKKSERFETSRLSTLSRGGNCVETLSWEDRKVRGNMLEGIFYGVEAGTVVANPLHYLEEDNGV